MKKKAIRKKSQSLHIDKPVAIVVSRFNKKISSGLLEGARKTLLELGLKDKQIKTFFVSGAFEIPLIAKKVGLSKKYAGVVALGCVIRGETPHFEFVSLGATMGCQMAQLCTGCPLAFGVLTVDNEAQAIARSSDDEFNKGREAVLALMESLETMKSI
jgi:6,7-dimethyl-8-ribityllumazine synthase